MAGDHERSKERTENQKNLKNLEFSGGVRVVQLVRGGCFNFNFINFIICYFLGSF